MKKIGITGPNGFIAYHLIQTLNLQKEQFEIVPFERDYFDKPEELDRFVAQCDVIVHLAALNRHADADELYRTNIGITQHLIDAMERTQSRPHVLISSSAQEDRDNIYGNSKREARELLVAWANRTESTFTGMVIPNVFGPFGSPFYNSVIATFSHQVSHGDEPKIEVDGNLKLIYVGELVSEMLKAIDEGMHEDRLIVAHTKEAKVSELLQLLQTYRKEYQENGEIPAINSSFELNLFNTYRCYMPLGAYFPRPFTAHKDQRGQFVELMRAGVSGQTSYSTTVPGITRGEHYHTRKVERFAVIQGKARIQLRRIGTEEILNFDLDGANPSYVDMPIWYTHNIKNTGDQELVTVFWINEPYNPEDPDTWFEKVELD